MPKYTTKNSKGSEWKVCTREEGQKWEYNTKGKKAVIPEDEIAKKIEKKVRIKREKKR